VYLKKLLLILCLGLAIPAGALAAEFTPDEVKEIKKAQEYLNSITTMEGDFQQVITANSAMPAGAISNGKIYLKKPGKLKWVYHAPSDIEIYVDKNVVTYYDKELDQISYTTLEHVLSNLIAEPKLDLMGDKLKVTKIRKDATGVSISIRKNEGEEDAEAEDHVTEVLTLTFLSKPYHLHRMQYWNSTGQMTTIQFLGLVLNQPIADEVFKFNNPRILKPKKR
jgi:outer membrane lipoprotein-sorting protein